MFPDLTPTEKPSGPRWPEILATLIAVAILTAAVVLAYHVAEALG